MEFAHKSNYFHSKFETFENTCMFRFIKHTEEEFLMRNPVLNLGETCCAIHLEMSVKQFPTSLPSGWRSKEYIPTILLPGENPRDVKQVKFGNGMILGYKLSPCTDIMADDIFRLRINNHNNSKNSNVVNLSEGGKDIISSNSNSSDDVTLHTSVAPCTGAELIYIKVPRELLLELMDDLDYLVGSLSFIFW